MDRKKLHSTIDLVLDLVELVAEAAKAEGGVDKVKEAARHQANKDRMHDAATHPKKPDDKVKYILGRQTGILYKVIREEIGLYVVTWVGSEGIEDQGFITKGISSIYTVLTEEEYRFLVGINKELRVDKLNKIRSGV